MALLCLALVLNGAGDAMAGLRMGCASAPGTVEHVAHAAVMKSDDAHAGHVADARHAGGHHADDAPMPADPAGDGDDDRCPHGDGCGDCATTCRNACLSQHVFALPPMPVIAASPAHADHAAPPLRAHPTPALPHPIRPPIGQAV
jgi:hypothetical protein